MKMQRMKIVIPIMIFHLLAIPFLIHHFLVKSESSVWDVQKSYGQSLLYQVRDEIAIHQMSLRGARGNLQKTINDIAIRKGFVGLALYNDRKDLIAATGDTGTIRPESSDITSLSLAPGKESLHVTRWIKNEVACQQCHGTQKDYLGVVAGVLPMSEISNQLELRRNRALTGVFFFLALLVTIIFLFHRYFITQPINELLNGIKRVKEGDLDVKVPVHRDDELGEMVGSFNELVHALGDAKKELENKHYAGMCRAEQLATVGEIAAGLAHEVKNPLAGISSALEVIVQDLPRSDQTRELLMQIIGETMRIAEIINRLLDYARPKEPKPDVYPVDGLVQEIGRIFSPQCQKQHVDFAVDVEYAAGNFCVDSQQLKQVLLNVLRNSLEAVNGNGKILLSASTGEDEVSFLLADNGSGMDPVTQARIFQPFYTTKPGGTGLGLPIVSRIVQDMGGTIAVNSTPGKGTTFRINLPRGCP